jgi:hypothetical protein
MKMGISTLEIQILQALVRGEQPSVRSSHRIRLEMLGLVQDGPQGLTITDAGRRAATMTSTVQAETADRPSLKVDSVGRRRMHQRGHALE